MREKELRIALICYGGISLAVYMHGVTKEVLRLARASRAFHEKKAPSEGSERVYHALLSRMEEAGATRVRVMVDILAGASAGGINAIFLAHAIASGRPLDPLTELWLHSADVDRLIEPAGGPVKRFFKGLAVPLAWALALRSGTIDRTVEAGHRDEVRSKLASFVRARWFAPPFGGMRFTRLLLAAFDAMDQGSDGVPLLPAYQPLDLFVTVTDLRGFPERVRLNSPPEIIEREHRLTLSFHDPGPGSASGAGGARTFAEVPELLFAARATASFPGAFPPFRASELDAVLGAHERVWPGRDAFLQRVLPKRSLEEAGRTILIDGSVLANAPFGPAIAALAKRPARREVDRRFVYIEPRPGPPSVRLTGNTGPDLPGFFATIFGALSDIPREQPIRDNLEEIERLSARIHRLRRIVEEMQPEVEAAVEKALGKTFFLARPTPKRLSAWRGRANAMAAKSAGYAYAAYAHLKIAAVTEDAAQTIFALGGGGDRARRERVRDAIWKEVRRRGLTDAQVVSGGQLADHAVLFLRDFDLGFRTRRLRFIVRRSERLVEEAEAAKRMRALFDDLLQRHQHRGETGPHDPGPFALAAEAPAAALETLARSWDLRPLDEITDLALSAAFAGLDKADRRRLILAYLGYPFYDVATLPLLQGEELDEFDPIRVDRISPDDAVAIRAGGAAATLKGVQLNSFGAFFSRAYRENDYLWGRLHGADRLIDILLSTLAEEDRLSADEEKEAKRQAFRAILAEEKQRLTRIPGLFEQLEREVG
ncbi:MAG: patatin-like protein [Sphingosinicella sp.]